MSASSPTRDSRRSRRRCSCAPQWPRRRRATSSAGGSSSSTTPRNPGRDWLRRRRTEAPMARATLGIVVLADTTTETFPGNWANDCAAAVENLLLAAHATGLGAVWLGVYPGDEREKAVAEIIEAPEGLRPFCMVALGRPETSGPEVDRYKPENVRVDRWSDGG